MSIKIVVLSPEFKSHSGTSAKNNKPYEFRTQTAYVYVINRETGKPVEIPEKIEVMLDKDQAPYARGDYELDSSSLYVSRNGRLEVSPRLVRIRETNPAAKV